MALARRLPPGAWLTALCLLLALAGAGAQPLGLPEGIALSLFVASYLAGGVPSALTGLASLRRWRVDVDLLMVLAALGAAALGKWGEGASLLFLFSLSNTLQEFAMDRTRRAIEAIMQLRPDKALLREPDGGERWVAVEDLRPGDRVVVRAGDRVPIDGAVLEGQSAADQSALTGESVPVEKGPGDDMLAGTINLTGTVLLRVTRLAGETVLSRIIRRVAESQQERAQTQQTIDRVEQYYAVTVIILTALTAIVPILLGAPRDTSIYRALIVMVVASPCAVAIAAPSAILSAIANSARQGILLKGGRYIEALSRVKVVALDKTGTITRGRPRVLEVVAAAGEDEAAVLRMAAAAERHSTHPLALAMVEAAAARDLDVPDSEGSQTLPGRGVVAAVAGENIWIGSPALAAEMGALVPSDLEAKLRNGAFAGKTVVLAGWGGRVRGAIALADTLRPGARQSIAALRSAGVEHVAMLTGDNEPVARAIAAEAGIDIVFSGLLPEQKVDAVRELAARHGPVAMVGDGVNDAPALAGASVGIAMGGTGTDVALETADVVLMSDELDKIRYAILLSRQTMRVVWQNLAFALSVITVFVLLAMLDRIPLAVGVIAHEGSTVIAMLYGLRMLTYRPKGAST